MAIAQSRALNAQLLLHDVTLMVDELITTSGPYGPEEVSTFRYVLNIARNRSSTKPYIRSRMT